jgi:hypothetical protein
MNDIKLELPIEADPQKVFQACVDPDRIGCIKAVSEDTESAE